MEERGTKRELGWALVFINAVSGVVWLLAAFGVVRGRGGINHLYLAVGLVSLLASVAWLMSRISS